MSYRRTGRGRDPYWITARYAGTDAKGRSFKQGERVFYYPNSPKQVLSGEHAEQASRDFEAACQDEAFYNSAY